MKREEVNAMLDVCLLGTGGMMPLPRRYLTALMTRYNGSSLLIDCGEGTQVAMKSKGWSPKPIDVICFTHMHGDHISGIPGLLLSMGNAERKDPVTIIGPRGVERVVKSLCVIAPELPFEINYIELTQPYQTLEIHGYKLEAYRLKHNVVCYGYNIIIERDGKFNLEKALQLPIPKNYWGRLQHGETVEYEGTVYTPEMVMGEKRRGLKVTYCTDSRPAPSILEHGNDADLFICEGMYGDKEMIAKAKDKKHMTFYEAAKIAAQTQPKQMWLTHYSPSLVRPEQYMDEVRKIFPNAYAGKDGMDLELRFDDEETKGAKVDG